jgi:hypothetical protein
MSMWKRQKIQKMLRCSGLGLLLAVAASAAVLPEQFGGYKKVARGVVDIADRPVWDEYGFQTAERADYEGAGSRVSVSVWKLKDTTGAHAAAQWLQPDAIQHGNYVLRLDGAVPETGLADLKSKLAEVDRAASPTLSQFLPVKNRLRTTERYILGPASLAKFEPRLPADLAGFNKGAEGQLARYRTEGGEAPLVLLSYPTPQIAGDRFRALEKRDLKARRHGPLVAVVFDATPQAAEKLLASVAYQPNVSWSEHVPKNENPGDMILAICILAGALMAASVVLGLFFSGFRLMIFGSKFGVQAIDQNFTSLHLDDRTESPSQ